MKKIFVLSNLIPLLLVVYIIKSFIINPSFFDFGIISLMSLGFLYKLKLDKDNHSDKDEILKKIEEIEDKYTKDFEELTATNAERISILEDKVSRNSLGVGLKTENLKNVRR